MKTKIKNILWFIPVAFVIVLLACMMFFSYFIFLWVLSTSVFTFWMGIACFLVFLVLQLYLYWRCDTSLLKRLWLASAVLVTPWLAMAGIYLFAWLCGIPIIVQ